MSEVITLKSKTREITGKAVSELRKRGIMPAVLYGHAVKPVNLEVDYAVFEKVFQKAGESTLVDLIVDDKQPVKVLIQDYQLEPRTSRLSHVDFHQVRMDEKLRTEIVLKFIGEAPIVKEQSGVLVTNIHEIEVECLPTALVHEIEVDITTLKTFEDVIHVSDLAIPADIKVLTAATEVVMLAQPPRSEQELADLEQKPEAPVVEAAPVVDTEKADSEASKE